MFLFWVVVFFLVLAMYGMLVVAGLLDLSMGRPPNHPLRRLARLLAAPFRGGAPDEEAVEEMARRLRGGPGSWPASG
ncbi:MAG: hypothetical protein QN163_02235 [Armatimonadota bacterium]|nr:hypothetical protein [Armatimonadota bacterium]MDR5696256.1 hypothetical protein [Armatimonadota bacterium]